jgi:hypothetical protein
MFKGTTLREDNTKVGSWDRKQGRSRWSVYDEGENHRGLFYFKLVAVIKKRLGLLHTRLWRRYPAR